jgi:hypothetical protein
MASVAAVAAADARQASSFGLRYLDADEPGGVQRQGALGVCWSTRFEDVSPVRRFPSYRGQRSFSGYYFAAAMGRHVGFESWLERDHLMMLDFSPQVEAFAAQPFWLSWSSGGRIRQHAPDFFARLTDGRGVVIDVRADDRIALEDAEAFEAAAAACESVGWVYRRVGALDPVLAANMRWLAGYRHPRCLREEHRVRLMEVSNEAMPLQAGVEVVGDRIAVLPSLFHLMWAGILATDLTSAPLRGSSMVSVCGGGR